MRRLDRAELAVEPDLELAGVAGLAGDVAPAAALAQVDVADEPFRGVEAPPALDELGGGPRLEDERRWRIELPRDEDLGVGRERDGGGAVAIVVLKRLIGP